MLDFKGNEIYKTDCYAEFENGDLALFNDRLDLPDIVRHYIELNDVSDLVRALGVTIHRGINE